MDLREAKKGTARPQAWTAILLTAAVLMAAAATRLLPALLLPSGGIMGVCRWTQEPDGYAFLSGTAGDGWWRRLVTLVPCPETWLPPAVFAATLGVWLAVLARLRTPTHGRFLFILGMTLHPLILGDTRAGMLDNDPLVQLLIAVISWAGMVHPVAGAALAGALSREWRGIALFAPLLLAAWACRRWPSIRLPVFTAMAVAAVALGMGYADGRVSELQPLPWPLFLLSAPLPWLLLDVYRTDRFRSLGLLLSGAFFLVASLGSARFASLGLPAVLALNAGLAGKLSWKGVIPRQAWAWAWFLAMAVLGLASFAYMGMKVPAYYTPEYRELAMAGGYDFQAVLAPWGDGHFIRWATGKRVYAEGGPRKDRGDGWEAVIRAGPCRGRLAAFHEAEAFLAPGRMLLVVPAAHAGGDWACFRRIGGNAAGLALAAQ